MSKVIPAKSKTFLIGEYCVLFGGSAIILATNPEFKLIVQEIEKETTISGVSKESPAFLFYIKHKDVFRNLTIEFIDPYKGSGGLGASSAQFTTLYKLYLSLTHCNFDVNLCLKDYKYFAEKASGSDCISQYYNQHTYFNSKNNTIENLGWNFENIDFAIFKTNFKTATHQHLSQLKPNFNISKLNIYVENVKQSFANKDSDCLISSVNLFYSSLNEFGLALDKTNALVEKIMDTEGVLAAKGCGAMCSDTILVIFDKNKKQNILATAKGLELIII
jgi:mevalonate kinase